jgi:hypothetical protein
MAVSLKHAFTSAIPDTADPSLVQPSNWNEEHDLTLATGKLLGRSTAGTGVAEEISIGSGLSLSSGTLFAAPSAIGYTIDGGGAVITTGVAGIGLILPYACTLLDWTLTADVSGAIKIDVWRDTYANFPPTDADSLTNGNEPEIAASGVKAQDTDLSNWTSVSINAGDILYFNVDSCASITKALLVFKVTKT